MNRAWGFDVSHWDIQSENGPIIDYGPLLQLQPSFAFVKVTDGLTVDARHAEHIAAIQQTGLVLGLYHWFWPTISVQSQLANFAAKIDQYDPPIIVVDNEQYYKSAKLRSDAAAGIIPWSDALIPPAQISTKGKEFMSLVSQAYPNKLLLNYTADWFVNNYCRPMGEWINDYPLWLAAYPYEKTSRTVTSWEEFETLREGLTEGYIQSRKPLNANQWLFWQWGADKLYLPAPYPKFFHVDLNVYNGTPEEFHTLFGGSQGGGTGGNGGEGGTGEEEGHEEFPQPVGVRYVCNTGQLHIRSEPRVAKATETGTFLFKGNEVSVYEVVNTFGRIDPVQSLWVGMTYMKKV